MSHRRPTKEELAAAFGKKVPDLLALNLKVVFCGINPGLYSAAVGHHFARPGNRFWPALHAGGFTERLVSPFDEKDLLACGVGITNIVERATAKSEELSREELVDGAIRLTRKIKRYRPKALALLGIDSYRKAFGEKNVSVGRQDRLIGDTMVWVLPNPSGLNAHYGAVDFARLFRELREAIG